MTRPISQSLALGCTLLTSACPQGGEQAGSQAASSSTSSTGAEPTPTSSGETSLTPTGTAPTSSTSTTSGTADNGSTTSETGGTSTNADSSSSGATDGSTENCGNGVLDPGEGCDEGYAGNSDVAGKCTLACQLPVCGDGLVWQGHEMCDFGPNNNDTVYNGCTTECTIGPSCGDSVVQGPEECDAGPGNGSGVPTSEDGVACESACRFVANVVFVSSAIYTGKGVDGVTGAHGHCVDLATAAGLDNADAFKAFVSAVGYTPADHFVHADIPYVRLDGIRVADDWNDLIQNGPSPGIVVTETKDHLMFGYVWTGTGPDGEMYLPEMTCTGWTSDMPDPVIKGRVGRISPDPDDTQWTSYANFGCHLDYRLYCFEQ